MPAPTAGYNIPVSFGFGTSASSGAITGPFSDSADIVFSGYLAPSISQPTDQTLTPTATTTVVPTTAEGSASVGLGGTSTGSGTAAGSTTSSWLWIALAAGAVGIYFYMRKG